MNRRRFFGVLAAAPAAVAASPATAVAGVNWSALDAMALARIADARAYVAMRTAQAQAFASVAPSSGTALFRAASPLAVLVYAPPS